MECPRMPLQPGLHALQKSPVVVSGDGSPGKGCARVKLPSSHSKAPLLCQSLGQPSPAQLCAVGLFWACPRVGHMVEGVRPAGQPLQALTQPLPLSLHHAGHVWLSMA